MKPSRPSVWTTKEGRRARELASLLKWPLFGALIAAGALGVARHLGPDVARELGAEGGQGFAEGVARAQERLAQLARGAMVSGTRGVYR